MQFVQTHAHQELSYTQFLEAALLQQSRRVSIKASTQQSQPLLPGSHKNKLLPTHEITETYINQRNLPFAKYLRRSGKTLRDRNLNIAILRTHVLFTDKKAE